MRIVIDITEDGKPLRLAEVLAAVFGQVAQQAAPAPAPKKDPAPAKTETASAPAPAKTDEAPKPAKETKPKAPKADKKAAPAEAPAPAEVEKPVAPATEPAKTGGEESGGISLDQIRDEIIAYTKAAGPKAAVALVSETTGASKASAVEPKDYPKLYKALKDALEAAAVAA